jgi:hypothetical protein
MMALLRPKSTAVTPATQFKWKEEDEIWDENNKVFFSIWAGLGWGANPGTSDFFVFISPSLLFR